VSGSERPLERVVVAADGRSGLTTPDVAAAVDRGRDAARAAAREGVGILVARGDDAEAEALAGWLTGDAADEEIRGPLGALRRLGTVGLCELTGLALGAGEAGIGLVCEGRAATAAAAIAVAVEPDLRARVRVAGGETLGLEGLR
jgi:nicotinate-nucleotide--dimethylbenzimidazole phosphoribosyltransferase